MKFQLSLLTCGSCGKPRGRYHACAGRRGRKDRLRPGIRVTCSKCGGRIQNPFTHTCRTRSDFAKRRRAAERAEKTRVRRERARKRKAEAAAKRKAAAAKRRAEARPRRKRTAGHVPRLCKDRECQRYGCLKYREGYEDGYRDGYRDGYAAGHADGRDEGYADGFADGFAAGAASVAAGSGR